MTGDYIYLDPFDSTKQRFAFIRNALMLKYIPALNQTIVAP